MKKIVITSGFFNPVLSGHINLFREAGTLNRHAKRLLAMATSEKSSVWTDGGCCCSRRIAKRIARMAIRMRPSRLLLPLGRNLLDAGNFWRPLNSSTRGLTKSSCARDSRTRIPPSSRWPRNWQTLGKSARPHRPARRLAQ